MPVTKIGICPVCGERTMEEHGTEPGDHHWYFCRSCGAVIDDDGGRGNGND